MPGENRSIICTIESGVARITLNQPPLNIIDIPMLGEIHSVLMRIHSENEAKVLVIDHQGKAFSAGVSIRDHTPDKVSAMIEKFHGMFRLLHSLALPTLALVDGMALGGGCELATFCDMVIASDRATFGQPEIKVGVFPPVAAVVFPHLIGRNRALELLLTGDVIDAAEAKAMGLINKVFPAQEFRQKADEFIGKLTSLSAPVLKLTKRAVDRALYATMSEGITSAEELYLGELMQTEDAHEGLNAYLEKRKPTWKNK
ncbi:MAG TPA: enoyl-CoA hydratase-related protein [Candidatus Acidoferrales bacterium]|nr:enoyl-CoA hydratase-related protein [Candidatus Acidoferrales bacterium]